MNNNGYIVIKKSTKEAADKDLQKLKNIFRIKNYRGVQCEKNYKYEVVYE